MSPQSIAFRGFANPVDPSSAELRAWAYRPDPAAVQAMPADWDLLVANDRLVGTLFDLALDKGCPARRFALHCLYIYAADAIRTKFQAHPKRRLRKLVEQAEEEDDELLGLWAHNTRVLLAVPNLFNYHDWCEGGLVRHPRKIKLPTPASAPALGPPPVLGAPPALPSRPASAAAREDHSGPGAEPARTGEPVLPPEPNLPALPAAGLSLYEGGGRPAGFGLSPPPPLPRRPTQRW